MSYVGVAPSLMPPAVGTPTSDTPTKSAAGGPWRRRLRSWITWVVVVLALALLALAGAESERGDLPLDPASARPGGTKALALLTERLGARFTPGADLPTAGAATTALLVRDDLDQAETAEVERWVRVGGRLVVADPRSSLAYAPLTDGGELGSIGRPRDLQAQCSDPLVEGVARIQPDDDRDYALFARPALDESPPNGLGESSITACFPSGEGNFLLTRRVGRGSIVLVGGPDLFTNRELGRADNSVLVANLLALQPGTSLTFLRSDGAEAGSAGNENSLLSLVPDGVAVGIAQLGVAGLLLLAWQGRRLGRPVIEHLPVAIPGSQLVIARSDLLQTAGRTNAAARLLRADLRRSVAERLGLPPGTNVEVLVAAAADRTRIAPERLRNVLVDGPIGDGRALTLLAQQVEAVHQEVTHVR